MLMPYQRLQRFSWILEEFPTWLCGIKNNVNVIVCLEEQWCYSTSSIHSFRMEIKLGRNEKGTLFQN